MPSPPSSKPPLTSETEADLFARLQTFKERSGARSLGEIVRTALEEFDLGSVANTTVQSRNMSVRIPRELLDELRTTAEAKEI